MRRTSAEALAILFPGDDQHTASIGSRRERDAFTPVQASLILAADHSDPIGGCVDGGDTLSNKVAVPVHAKDRKVTDTAGPVDDTHPSGAVGDVGGGSVERSGYRL